MCGAMAGGYGSRHALSRKLPMEIKTTDNRLHALKMAIEIGQTKTTAEADVMRALFGVPKCAKGHGDCHPNCEYGLAGPCVNRALKEVTDAE